MQFSLNRGYLVRRYLSHGGLDLFVGPLSSRRITFVQRLNVHLTEERWSTSFYNRFPWAIICVGDSCLNLLASISLVFSPSRSLKNEASYVVMRPFENCKRTLFVTYVVLTFYGYVFCRDSSKLNQSRRVPARSSSEPTNYFLAIRSLSLSVKNKTLFVTSPFLVSRC